MLRTKALSAQWAISALTSCHFLPLKISSNHIAYSLVFQTHQSISASGLLHLLFPLTRALVLIFLGLLPYCTQSYSSVLFSEVFLHLSKAEPLPLSRPSLSSNPALLFFIVLITTWPVFWMYLFVGLLSASFAFMWSPKGQRFALITFVAPSSWRVLNKYRIYVVGERRVCWEGGSGKHREVMCNKPRSRLGPDFWISDWI